MNTVKEILSAKGTNVSTICESAAILDAVKQMNGQRIGCLVVTCDDGEVIGIVAERDVLQFIATEQQDLSQVRVGRVMTRNVIVCSPEDCLEKARVIMKRHWVRQIPVIDDDGMLRGIVSIGDVNALSLTEDKIEISGRCHRRSLSLVADGLRQAPASRLEDVAAGKSRSDIIR